jgi:hypothetical protein
MIVSRSFVARSSSAAGVARHRLRQPRLRPTGCVILRPILLIGFTAKGRQGFTAKGRREFTAKGRRQ